MRHWRGICKGLYHAIGIFEPLKDLRNFVQFGLTHWALEWYNGADFAPDYLYRNGVEA